MCGFAEVALRGKTSPIGKLRPYLSIQVTSSANLFPNV